MTGIAQSCKPTPDGVAATPAAVRDANFSVQVSAAGLHVAPAMACGRGSALDLQRLRAAAHTRRGAAAGV